MRRALGVQEWSSQRCPRRSTGRTHPAKQHATCCILEPATCSATRVDAPSQHGPGTPCKATDATWCATWRIRASERLFRLHVASCTLRVASYGTVALQHRMPHVARGLHLTAAGKRAAASAVRVLGKTPPKEIQARIGDEREHGGDLILRTNDKTVGTMRKTVH